MLQVLRVSLGQSLLSRLFLSPSQHTKSLSLHGSRFSSLQRSASFTIPTVNPFMLRVAFLAYVLILPTLFASAIAEQLDFRAKNTVAEYPLVYHNDCRLICTCTSSRNISPTSQVFCLDGEPRHASIHSRHRSLGRLKPTDIRLLRAAWHSRGPRLHRLRDIVLNHQGKPPALARGNPNKLAIIFEIISIIVISLPQTKIYLIRSKAHKRDSLWIMYG